MCLKDGRSGSNYCPQKTLKISKHTKKPEVSNLGSIFKAKKIGQSPTKNQNTLCV